MAYEIIVLTNMLIAILFAQSLNLITGFCGQVSLGHAGFPWHRGIYKRNVNQIRMAACHDIYSSHGDCGDDWHDCWCRVITSAS